MLFKRKAPAEMPEDTQETEDNVVAVAPQADASEVAEAAQLLWSEAQRQISRQESDIDTLRTRAVAVLSVAALVAGLFGSHISTAPHRHTWVGWAVAAALVLFAASVVCAVVVMMPRGWTFGESLTEYVARVRAGNLVPIDVTTNMAEHVQEWHDSNQVTLNGLYTWFGVTCVLVGLQVLAWGVAVI